MTTKSRSGVKSLTSIGMSQFRFVFHVVQMNIIIMVRYRRILLSSESGFTLWTCSLDIELYRCVQFNVFPVVNVETFNRYWRSLKKCVPH
jgi:hypothetical protein